MDVKGNHEIPSKVEEVLATMTARSEESVFFWDVTSLSVALYALIPIHIQVALLWASPTHCVNSVVLK